MKRNVVISLVCAAALLAGAATSHGQNLIKDLSACTLMPELFSKPYPVTPVPMPLYSQDTVTICLLGDVMMHTEQIRNASRKGGGYDFSTYFKHIKDRIAEADIAIANMEFTLSGEPYTGYPSFSAPDSFAEYLASCGIDVLLGANNHIFDKGCEGAQRTLKELEKLKDRYGVQICGLACDQEHRNSTNPLVIRKRNIRIALLNMTYGTNLGADRHWPKTNYMSDTTRIKEALIKAEETDFTLVLPHWGTEYELRHSEEQERSAGWMARNGADMIIGTHPHVVQDRDTIDNVPVIYSLGNAVSNMSAANTQIGLMVTVSLARKDNGDIEVLPVEHTWLWCSRPGGYCDSYCVLPVEEFIGSRESWKGPWEYDKMTATFERVLDATQARQNDVSGKI